MKARLYFILLTVLSLFIAACKEDDNPADPGPGDTANYFPGGTETYYLFEIEVQDSTGAAVTGERSVRYTGTTTLSGRQYIHETDSIFTGGVTSTTDAYFRKASDGIFYFLDTAGLGETIPDTMMQYITFSSEIKAFTLPFETGTNWNVFKMTLKYLIIQLDIVDVSASVTGKENIVLNLTSGQVTKEALKVRFVFKLTIPDPQNPFSNFTQTLEAFSWVVKDIGVVKWQGNATVLGAFTGSGINFGDSTSTVSQSLINYDIK